MVASQFLMINGWGYRIRMGLWGFEKDLRNKILLIDKSYIFEADIFEQRRLITYTCYVS